MKAFSPYQKLVVFLLALIQFTIILDFMVLSPLGPFLMSDLQLEPNQFAAVVSVYAFGAFVSAVMTAGFADKFDRKKLLLFFYIGFIVGTFLCAISSSYVALLASRLLTGIFGGVIGSVIYAIITDLFPFEFRGRVMGFVQMAFAASQILGIPVGLYLANISGWHLPFLCIVGLGIITMIFIQFKLRPITEHLLEKREGSAWSHFTATLKNRSYLRGFAVTTVLATGGFMLMPFGSEFASENLGISLESLPLMYLITGVFTMFFGPLFGRLSDQVGKLKMYILSTSLAIIIVGIYTSLGLTAFGMVVMLNVILFAGITGRMVSATALVTSIPAQKDRGAFMSINSATQQLSGGIASLIAGGIVYREADGTLGNYTLLGGVVIATMILSIILMIRVNSMLQQRKITDEKVINLPL